MRAGPPVPREPSTDTVLCTNRRSNKTKPKKKQSREQKKKTGKTWCSTSTVPSSHATTEWVRERENSHTRVLLSQSATLHSHARENATPLHTNSIYLHTRCSFTISHTHTHILQISICININLLTNQCLISPPAQINRTRSSLALSSVELF